jgi:hypothetical protein
VLYIVLILVVAALALLVTALITATSLWAWVSIGLSVLAGVILLFDWLRRRKRSAAAEAEPSTEDTAGTEDTKDGENTAEAPAEDDAEPTALLPATGELGDPADVPDPVIEPEGDEPEDSSPAVVGATVGTTAGESPAPAAEPAGSGLGATKVTKPDSAAPPAARENAPGEEETDEDDLAIVSDLEDEVVVVDEYPRYHLVDCGWLSGRDTIPIAVGEARQLGFTPCSRCGPDAVLAAAHR